MSDKIKEKIFETIENHAVLTIMLIKGTQQSMFWWYGPTKINNK